MQGVARHEIPQYTRHEEGETAEAYACMPVSTETAHIHLQAGEEHDIVDADLSEEFERSIASQYIETMFTQHYTSQDEADDVRHMQTPEDDGRQQQNEQHDEENPRRIGDQRFHCGAKVVKSLKFKGQSVKFLLFGWQFVVHLRKMLCFFDKKMQKRAVALVLCHEKGRFCDILECDTPRIL